MKKGNKMNNTTKEHLSEQMFEIADMVEELQQQLLTIKEKTLTLEKELQLFQTEEKSVSSRKTRKTITQREIATVIGLYKNEETAENIAKVANLSQPTVSRIINCYRDSKPNFVTVDLYQQWRSKKYDKCLVGDLDE